MVLSTEWPSHLSLCCATARVFTRDLDATRATATRTRTQGGAPRAAVNDTSSHNTYAHPSPVNGYFLLRPPAPPAVPQTRRTLISTQLCSSQNKEIQIHRSKSFYCCRLSRVQTDDIVVSTGFSSRTATLDILHPWYLVFLRCTQQSARICLMLVSGHDNRLIIVS